MLIAFSCPRPWRQFSSATCCNNLIRPETSPGNDSRIKIYDQLFFSRRNSLGKSIKICFMLATKVFCLLIPSRIQALRVYSFTGFVNDFFLRNFYRKTVDEKKLRQGRWISLFRAVFPRAIVSNPHHLSCICKKIPNATFLYFSTHR